MLTLLHFNVVDKKQISVPATIDRAMKFGIWCKANDMTQEEGFAKLVDEHVPDMKIEYKVL